MVFRDPVHRAVRIIRQLATEGVRKTARRRLRGWLRMGTRQDYLDMQKSYYASHAVDEESARLIVHPNYELASRQTTSYLGYVLNDFAERRAVLDQTHQISAVRRAFLEPKPARALDFGCGVGRNMAELARNGFAVDGVDISEQMLSFARQNPLLADSRFFVSNGSDCGSAPAGEYDLVLSTLCMQHICCRSIRAQILSAIHRVLRDHGVIHVQFHFYPTTMASDVPAPHAPWAEDQFSATATNSEADVWVTPDQLQLVWEDFGRLFRDLRFSFVDFPKTTVLYTENYARPFGHLLVSASKGFAVADRIYRDREDASTQA